MTGASCLVRRKFTDEQFLELYRQGLGDREIARRLGVNVGTVWIRRKKLGLPPNRPRGGPRKFTDEQLLSLYRMGLTDREIAERLGVDRSGVCVRRRMLGLPPNVKPRIDVERLKRLLSSGKTASQVAEELGVHPTTVYKWVKRLKMAEREVRVVDGIVYSVHPDHDRLLRLAEEVRKHPDGYVSEERCREIVEEYRRLVGELPKPLESYRCPGYYRLYRLPVELMQRRILDRAAELVEIIEVRPLHDEGDR